MALSDAVAASKRADSANYLSLGHLHKLLHYFFLGHLRKLLHYLQLSGKSQQQFPKPWQVAVH